MDSSPNRTKSDLDLKRIVSGLLAGGGVFALGGVISRLASIAFLPIYTRLLTPSDYGVIAILDVVQDFLRLAIGTSLFTAANRLHFETESDDERARIWWVALLALTGLTLAITVPLALLSPWLASVTFGRSFEGGPRLFFLMLAALWFALPEIMLQVHLQVSKRAPLLVGLSFARMGCNAALNVALLYFFHLGVAGILWGNLLTAVIGLSVQLVIFVRLRGRPRVNWRLLPRMAHFGGPLVLVGIVSLAIHQVDRYILAQFVGVHDIGIYSLAYQMGQGINSLVLVPFAQVWAVGVFEIAKLQNANRVFAEVFSAFVRGLSLVLLAAAFTAEPLVAFLAPPEYRGAAKLVPVIALAYLFFSLDDHLRVPALVQKKTTRLLPVYVMTLGLNIALNLWWVQQYGIAGAAWATVGSFVGFAVLGFFVYRRIDKIPYSLLDTGLTVGSAVGAFALFRLLAGTSVLLQFLAATALWLLLACVFAVRPIRAFQQAGLFEALRQRYSRWERAPLAPNRTGL